MAVWLPLFIGEPNLLSPCPTHGAYAVAHASAVAAHHHGHASMASHGASGSKQSAPSHDEKDCSCIGGCSPGVARAAVANAAIVAIATVAYGHAPAFPSADTQPQPAPDLSRPYPTGPPRA